MQRRFSWRKSCATPRTISAITACKKRDLFSCLTKSSIFFDSVKDYINSGLDKKVIDSDGGIHYQRLRAEKENQNTSGKQQPANCRVEWPNEDWAKKKVIARVPALFYILSSIWCIKRRRKKARSF